jgi:hypothetical protein
LLRGLSLRSSGASLRVNKGQPKPPRTEGSFPGLSPERPFAWRARGTRRGGQRAAFLPGLEPASSCVRCICAGCGRGRRRWPISCAAWFLVSLATALPCPFRSRVSVVCAWRACPALPAEPG